MRITLDAWQETALAVALIVIGLSFAFKFFRAVILGKLWYWTGFLPFTLISPFVILWHGSKRSLIREAQGFWVYVLMGPIFLILSILLIEAGLDLFGVPATDSINYVINGGNTLRPPAIRFDKQRYAYSFPFLVRGGGQFVEKINKYSVPLSEKDKLLHTH
jgi:hypothetical protein